MKAFFARIGQQLARVVLLVLIVAASGVGLGLAAGYPVSRIELSEADAVRLDHSSLVGEIDPELALVAAADLEMGWEPADPALAAFGMLGTEICGREVPLPVGLSEVKGVVYTNPADEALLISQAVRVDRWQSARGYVDDVAAAVGDCERFYRSSGEDRVEMIVTDETSAAPITDHVSRTFRAADGSQVQTWSVMAVGDVVITVFYSGPTRPRQGFFPELEQEILMRVDPDDFAPGGTTTTLPDTEPTTSVPSDQSTSTTVLEDGAADETGTGD